MFFHRLAFSFFFFLSLVSLTLCTPQRSYALDQTSLHLDFGTSSSPVASGYERCPLVAYDSTRGYGWQSTTNRTAQDRRTKDPLTRDMHLGKQGNFMVSLLPGNYQVTVTMGDSSYIRDNIDIWLQGQRVAQGVTTAKGSFVNKSFQVATSDGLITLGLVDTGGKNAKFAINGLDIVQVVAPPTPTPTATPTATPTVSPTPRPSATPTGTPTPTPAATPTPTPTPNPTATSTQTPTPSPTVTPTLPPSGNIALTGTAYSWFGMPNSTSISNQTAISELNDGNLTQDIQLNGSGADIVNAYEGAGVIWPSIQSLNRVVFMNGSYDSGADGVFNADFKLQSTNDGTTWMDVAGRTLSPAYAYNSPAAGGVTYAFFGSTFSARGVRVVGMVRTSEQAPNSWFVRTREIQMFFDLQTPTPTATPIPTMTPTATPTIAPTPTPTGPGGTLANIGLTSGWASFGQVLPKGAAFGRLQLGSLTTQTDVKNLWAADGSIRYAVVTAYVPSAGTYALHQGQGQTGSFTPQFPNAYVQFNIGGTVYTANLPQSLSSDLWLSGPLVDETRWIVTPTQSNGTAHPFLKVYFDERVYSGGGSHLDVAVENTLDVAGATAVTYNVDIFANGQNVFSRSNVNHYYLTRWRKVFDVGLTKAQVTPDFTPFYQAKAVPQFLSIVLDKTYDTSGSQFDILGKGNLYPYMPEAGEDYSREELGLYPSWVARYLAHGRDSQRNFTLANGDLAGSWPVHIRNADGSLISIDQRPNYWLDGRWYPWGDGPAGGNKLTEYLGPLKPDVAHQPSLAYIPYLMTGDRYYADEMKFWGNYDIIGQWGGDGNADRQGSQGLIVTESQNYQIRAMAWALRNMTDAAAYTPDADPFKAYMTQKVNNNLVWLDSYANRHITPLGTSFEKLGGTGGVEMIQWQCNFVAWAIDHANQQGFSGAENLKKKIVEFQNKLFNSPEWPRQEAASYYLIVKDASGNYYTTLSQVHQATQSGGGLKNQFQGYWGVDARLSLMMGIRMGLPGAQSSYDYLYPFIYGTPDPNGSPYGSDLMFRSMWSIAY